MKHVTKCFFLLLATALFWAMPANTWGDITIDGIKYSLNSPRMAVSVIGYSGSSTAVTIPGMIKDGGKNYTVIGIGFMAFASCTGLTSIEIPASITEIEYGVFDHCINLTSVTFAGGSKLKIIGERAFASCESLTSIEIPAGVTSIGDSAFASCNRLTSIEIPASITEIEYGAFKNCTNLTSVTFAEGSKLKIIGDYAFASCKRLASIEIPAGVTSIGRDAFEDCTGLASVTFAEESNPENIGSNAFASCTGLTSIEIPASITEIGHKTFNNCTNLTFVTFAKGSNLKNIRVRAFENCTGLASIEVPAGATEIGSYAFENCTGLASVTFAEGSKLKIIRDGAFYCCTSLASIKIPAGVTFIGKNAFDPCTKVTWADSGIWKSKPAIDADFIEGKLVLAFTGTLEGSEDGKQWTAINAASPYTVEMTGAGKFFRAVGVQGGSEQGGEGGAEVGKNFIIPLSDTVELEMIWVEPGTFVMGSPEDELGRRDDETQHQVTLTKGYWLGKYEVTQGQYEAVMEGNPSSFKGENLPVEMVSWEDATNFCAELTKTERAAGRLPEGYEYTLPTEAQWEYACRAGTTTALNSGKNLTDEYECSNVDKVGWYYYNSDRQTHPVGGKQPNTWGFYDMHGNVYEWCLDWFGDYPTGSVTDPTGPATGSYRVIRGGCWSHLAYYCRSASRNRNYPSDNYIDCGFRVALSPVQ